jgi:hypothetical protein
MKEKLPWRTLYLHWAQKLPDERNLHVHPASGELGRAQG